MTESDSNDTRRRKAGCPHPPVARSTRPRARWRTLHHREFFAITQLVLGTVCLAAVLSSAREIAILALLAMVVLSVLAVMADGRWFERRRDPPRASASTPRRRPDPPETGCGPG